MFSTRIIAAPPTHTSHTRSATITVAQKYYTVTYKDGYESELGNVRQLSDAQAQAIVDMTLGKLTGMERQKIEEELLRLHKLIEELRAILADINKIKEIVKKEMTEIKDKYSDPRRTEIVYSSEEFNPEDFYADEDMVITISHMGYIKRTPLAEYRIQNRGGVGMKGSATRDEDFIEHIYVASMHNTMMFFTEKGRCYWLKVYNIPEGSRASKGRAIQNVIQIEPDDKVKAYINLKTLSDQEYLDNNYIILCTKKGVIKKTSLEAYSRPRQNGIIAITIREGDELLEAKMTNGTCEIMMGSKYGKVVRFNEENVRPMGRNASGVKGITLQNEEDEVIGMLCIDNKEENILVVSEKGYGKRSDLEEYRVTNRGGKGVKTINITDKTGQLIAITNVTDENDLMIINKSGIVIRMRVADLRVLGRATQGVKLINLRGNDEIASITKVDTEDEEVSTEISNDVQTEANENNTSNENIENK